MKKFNLILIISYLYCSFSIGEHIYESNTELSTNYVQDILKDDFLVNDDVGIEIQENPSIAVAANGSYVIVWEDYRSNSGEIYFQRFNDYGDSLGKNIRVGRGYNPCIAMDSIGNFSIVWSASSFDPSNLYFQTFNEDGDSVSTKIKVNDVDSAVCTNPSIAMGVNGNITIVWEDYRNSGEYGSDIYCQSYDANMNIKGVNIKVNGDNGNFEQYDPDIAVNNDSNVVIVWEDNRDDNSDIYSQRYNADLVSLGNNQKVNADTGTTSQISPAVSMNAGGNYIITWTDLRLFNYDIYCQKYNASGITQGENINLNDGSTGSEYFSNVELMNSGNFVVAWLHNIGTQDVHFRQFNSEGVPISDEFKVNDGEGYASKWSFSVPSLGMDNDGNVVISWSDFRNGNYDIYNQQYTNNGTKLGVNNKVNDDLGTTNQIWPVIAQNENGYAVIAWLDKRNHENDYFYDIYFQCYDSSGNKLGSNVLVGGGYLPAVAMSDDEEFIISWRASSNIHYSRFDISGNVISNSIKVNDTETGWRESPAITFDDRGYVVVVWADSRDGDSDIFYQRYNSIGTALGVNTKVNDDEGDRNQYSPDIAVDGEGKFVIVWDDNRNGESDIYLQRYNSAGTVQGPNLKVVDEEENASQYFPTISMNSSGTFVIAWRDERPATDEDIYYQYFNSDGSPNGPNLKVNSHNTNEQNNYRPSVSIANDGKFIIVWSNQGHESRGILWAQRFLPDRSFWGSNFNVEKEYQTYDIHNESTSISVSTKTDKIFYTWNGYYNNTNWNIYAKIATWDWTGVLGVEPFIFSGSIQGYKLLQNYPNPFNPSTSIEFTLPKPEIVTLEIFNILGQKIETLLNKTMLAGYHEIEFNGHNLSSGIYMYRIKAGDWQDMKKMVLLK